MLHFLKVTFVLFCFFLTAPLWASTQMMYSSVSEMLDFPYLATYVGEQEKLNRVEVLEKVRQDQAEMAKDPQSNKPLRAETYENHLSHLLNWMVNSLPNKIIGMAIYDKSGLLLGFSTPGNEVCRKTNINIKDKDYYQLFPVALDDEYFKKITSAIPSQRKPSASADFPLVEATDIKTLNLTGEGLYDNKDNLIGYVLFLIKN